MRFLDCEPLCESLNMYFVNTHSRSTYRRISTLTSDLPDLCIGYFWLNLFRFVPHFLSSINLQEKTHLSIGVHINSGSQRLRWVGHVERKPDDRYTPKIMTKKDCSSESDPEAGRGRGS